MDKWMAVGTWSFSEVYIDEAVKVLKAGGNAIDATVEMIKGIEADPAIDSVGLGGLPGWDGVIDLDSAVMDGETLEMGAVGSLEGFVHPIEIARDILKNSAYSLLVGGGAQQYADRRGFERGNLLTPGSVAAWQKLKAEYAGTTDAYKEPEKPVGHDTVGVVARGADGHFCAATSTSGLALKTKGRVGDSPVCGAGLYADDRRGAAAATGVGEDIMRSVLSYRVVDRMGRGETAMQACENALREALADMKKAGRESGNMAVVAIDVNGGYGFASSHNEFSCTVAGDETGKQSFRPKAVKA